MFDGFLFSIALLVVLLSNAVGERFRKTLSASGRRNLAKDDIRSRNLRAALDLLRGVGMKVFSWVV